MFNIGYKNIKDLLNLFFFDFIKHFSKIPVHPYQLYYLKLNLTSFLIWEMLNGMIFFQIQVKYLTNNSFLKKYNNIKLMFKEEFYIPSIKFIKNTQYRSFNLRKKKKKIKFKKTIVLSCLFNFWQLWLNCYKLEIQIFVK